MLHCPGIPKRSPLRTGEGPDLWRESAGCTARDYSGVGTEATSKRNQLAFVARLKYWSEQRLEAAKAAAPYLHPRLQSIEHTGKEADPFQHTVQLEFV